MGRKEEKQHMAKGELNTKAVLEATEQHMRSLASIAQSGQEPGSDKTVVERVAEILKVTPQQLKPYEKTIETAVVTCLRSEVARHRPEF